MGQIIKKKASNEEIVFNFMRRMKRGKRVNLTADLIAEHTHMPVEEVESILRKLEKKGRVRQNGPKQKLLRGAVKG